MRWCSNDRHTHLQAHQKGRGMASRSIASQNDTGEHLSSRRPAKIGQLLPGRVPLKTRRTMSGASNTALPTAPVNPYDRLKAKPVKSRAGVSSNGKVQPAGGHPDVQRLHQPDTLLRCHLCPKVQGTFLAVRAHIRTNHKGQHLQCKCNERGLQTESPSLLQQHQIRARIADIAKATEPGSAGAAIPTATDGDITTGPTDRFEKNSLHLG